MILQVTDIPVRGVGLTVLAIQSRLKLIRSSFSYEFTNYRYHVLLLLKTCAILMQMENDFTHLVVEQFGMPHQFDLPIRPTLSASGDSAIPEVVADPQGEVGDIFQNLGVCVVQQCAKIRQQVSTAVMYNKSIKAIKVKVPDSNEEFLLHPATVWRNDRSAQSMQI
ncbi:hypothetical protein L2E82_49092 [Cichorium intybus]|uniref:Uncharacterized protein n=1 Tax=Cichorium intybus TaxID=13427 RepID=A0ACB8Z3R7_CICIN|nr:hypothetical protein L2E82_49092 [Cichorium intybus]